MNYREFKSEVEKDVKELLIKQGISCSVKIYEIQKNNGIKFDALCICKKRENLGINFYLNSYYEDYRKGVSIIDIVKEIIDNYKNSKLLELKNIGSLLEFDYIKDRIFLCLINYGKNKDMLKNCPYKRFLDLAITIRCNFCIDQNGIASSLIHDSLLESWNVDLDELYEIAFHNTIQKFPYKITPIMQAISEITHNVTNDDINNELSCIAKDVQDMYILTNDIGINGATCLLYDGVIKNFAEEKNSNVFILPSSIHEVLLLPESIGVESSVLCDMVISINRDVVSLTEVLSNSVYYYDRSTDKITVV